MADKDARLPDNAEGAYYVDENCSNSGICREIAPELFGHNRAAGYSFVAKQPASEAERALMRKALEGCPMNAIGDDGD